MTSNDESTKAVLNVQHMKCFMPHVHLISFLMQEAKHIKFISLFCQFVKSYQ